MPTTQKQLVNSVVDLLTTELNSLANNTMCAAGSAVNNVSGGTTDADGYVRGSVQLTLATYSGTPTAYTGVCLWFLKSVDGGSTYEDGSSSVTPARPPDLVIPVRNVSSGPQVITRQCWVPAGYWKPIAKNDGTGITFAASGNSIKIEFATDSGQ